MLMWKFVVSVLIILVATFSVFSLPVRVFADASAADARSAIVSAQGELVTCYQAVANASGAGANVSGLIRVLDEAGGNLSRADLAFNMSDFSDAQSYALQSLNLLVQSNVTSRAADLKSSASQASFRDFMVYVVGSLVLTVAVICGGFVVWTLLKKRYARNRSAAK